MALNRLFQHPVARSEARVAQTAARTFGESDERRDSSVGDVVDERDDGAGFCGEELPSVATAVRRLAMLRTRNRTFEPIALP